VLLAIDIGLFKEVNRKSRKFRISWAVGANKLMIFGINRPTENHSNRNCCLLEAYPPIKLTALVWNSAQLVADGLSFCFFTFLFFVIPWELYFPLP